MSRPLSANQLMRRPPPVRAGAAPAMDKREEAFWGAVTPLRSRQEYASEIGGLWKRAQDSFIKIGQYLALAKQTLEHGEYEAMITSDLPFDPRTAYIIRQAAQAVVSGRLPRERLPPSYSVIYQLATLDDDGLRDAEKDGLIRPDVRRSEVVEWKKRRSALETLAEARVLMGQRTRLLKQQAKLATELERIEQRLREIGSAPTIIDSAAEDLSHLGG
jgi:hypothetical protein